MASPSNGPGYFMVGDAACFIDPLLSTGVHLATHGSMLAAASIASMIRGEVTEEQAQQLSHSDYNDPTALNEAFMSSYRVLRI